MPSKKLTPEEQAARIAKRMDDNLRKIAERGVGVDSVIGSTVLRLLAIHSHITKTMIEDDLAQQLANTRRGKDPNVSYDIAFHGIDFALKAVQSLPDIQQKTE